VPYDAGCLIVRDGDAHRAAFATEPPYLARFTSGTGAVKEGTSWPADLGVDLSRGFRALKASWLHLKRFCISSLLALHAWGTISYTHTVLQFIRARVQIWFTLRQYGTAALGAAVLRNVRQAASLAALVDEASDLERLAPVHLNIVCFRFVPVLSVADASGPRALDEDALNELNR
jgi:aromatic-L-amino-acid/L-tryptophan decarboxylase